MFRKSVLATALSITTFSSVANADNTPDTMIVTANRFEQPEKTVLAASSVVTREEIKRWQSTSLNQVLERLPGISVSQYGGLGTLSSVYVRGTNSDHVLVLIDGIPLNNGGISSSTDFSQIPLSIIQRVEYIRGPRSSVYGSDAIGGVINIITTNKHPGTELSAKVGSNRYNAFDGAFQHNFGDTTLTLSGNYTYTRGFDIAPKDVQPRQPDRDGFMSKAFYGSVEHQFNEYLNGFFRGYGYSNRTGYDGYWNTRQLYSQNWDTGLRYSQGIYSSQLVASYGRTKDQNYDSTQGRYSPSTTIDDIEQYTTSWNNTFDLGNGNVAVGVDWRKQKTQPETDWVNEGRSWHNTGIYLTGMQQIDAVTLEAAVRNDDNSEFDSKATWSTSAAYEFVDGYRIFASYGTAYKAPTLSQRYSRAFGGNPNLRPESSKQWEGGFEGLTGVVSWRVSAYRNDIEDMIAWAGEYYNIDKARIKGVEATAQFSTGDISHQVSYDYTDPRNAETNKILQRRAKQQVKYQLDWQMMDLDWNIAYRYLGKRFEDKANTIELSGVSLWDAGVSYPVTDQLTVRGKVQNLFDKNYETAYGYRTAGREIFLSGEYFF